MLITKEITIDLQYRGVTEPLEAVQYDACTRAVKVSLLNGGEAWMPPAGAVVSVAFKKPDGTSGWYDKLPDGKTACNVAGNTVTAVLAPQMLTAAGKVHAAVIFQDSKLNQLATFVFKVCVQANPAAGKGISNDYYKYSTMEQLSVAVNGWLTETEAEKNDFLSKAEKALAAICESVTEDAPAIVCEASGCEVSVSDASDRLLHGLTLYGKTTQNGTPTPSSPVELVSAGASSSILATITDGTENNVQNIFIKTPNGLPGVPVSSNGNYTDESGQQWICDEIDFARGVYVQRIRWLELKGTESYALANSTNGKYIMYGDFSYEISNGDYGYCTHFMYSQTKAYVGNLNYIGLSPLSTGARLWICSAMNVANAKAFFAERYAAGNPVTVQYILDTPVETALPADEMAAYYTLHSNKANTIAYNNAGAGMQLAYVADTKKYIDNKFSELAAALVHNT